jgi:nucleoside phosphorylase
VFVCAGEIEQFGFAVPIGIGMVDTAIGLTKLCEDRRPEFIMFVGSAGSYGKHKIFDIVHSKSASQIENSFFVNNTYTPIENLISTADDVSCETIVNSSNYITTDSSLSSSYLEKGIGIENMEFFSVMRVAQKLGIPVAGIFIVTNYCNSQAHSDFLSNHKEAMMRLEMYIMQDNVKRD